MTYPLFTKHFWGGRQEREERKGKVERRRAAAENEHSATSDNQYIPPPPLAMTVTVAYNHILNVPAIASSIEFNKTTSKDGAIPQGISWKCCFNSWQITF
jgi:hypothetical protein